MFNELNKQFSSTIKEGIDLESMEFKPLKDFIGKTVKVDGFFFTKSDYGEQVVVVGNGAKINMPKRAVDIFKNIQASSEMLDAVLSGKLEIINITPVKCKNGVETTGYELHDC